MIKQCTNRTKIVWISNPAWMYIQHNVTLFQHNKVDVKFSESFQQFTVALKQNEILMFALFMVAILITHFSNWRHQFSPDWDWGGNFITLMAIFCLLDLASKDDDCSCKFASCWNMIGIIAVICYIILKIGWRNEVEVNHQTLQGKKGDISSHFYKIWISSGGENHHFAA